VDLADEQQVRAAAQRGVDQACRCDVLVHAAAALTGQVLCTDGGLVMR
jgi:NAD(P)-dependent dehydrogenase (short-subunit alcohol dehydrogenase family)